MLQVFDGPVFSDAAMALNPNYENIGKAFTTQYYQVRFAGVGWFAVTVIHVFDALAVSGSLKILGSNDPEYGLVSTFQI